MLLDLVQPQVFPCAENLAAFFAGITDSCRACDFILLHDVEANKPFCYPYQVYPVTGCQPYIDMDCLMTISCLDLAPTSDATKASNCSSISRGYPVQIPIMSARGIMSAKTVLDRK